MRSLSYLFLTCALAVPVFSSPVAVDLSAPTHRLVKRMCSFNTWDSSNISNWDAAGTDQWLESWWSKYLGGNGPDTSAIIPNGWPNDFTNLLGRMYLSNERYHCSDNDGQGGDTCWDELECSDLKCTGNWGPECASFDTLRPVYMTMVSVLTMQQYFNELKTVLDESQLNFQGMSAYLVDNFFPHPSSESSEFLKLFFTSLAAVFSISGAYAKLIPAIAKNNVAKESSSASGALLGGIGNGFKESVEAPSDERFQDLANLGTFMTNIFEQSRAMLESMEATLAPGKSWNTKFFKDYAEHGVFLPISASSTFSPGINKASVTTLRQYMQKQFNARAINSIWRQQKIFITYTTDVDGSCEQDKQGPQDLKYCKPGDPGVYYLYWWSQKTVGAGTTLGIDSFDTGKMDYPPGHDKLAAGWIDPDYQLNINDTLISSVSAFQVGGLNYSQDMATDRASLALSQGFANPWDQDTQWEGTFTIPVCNTGDVSYNSPLGGRFMPCNCGGDGSQVNDFRNASNMVGYGVYDEQCTADKQAARKNERHPPAAKGPDSSSLPNLPSTVNQIACLADDGTTTPDMVALLQDCQEAVANLGSDDSKQVCSSDCSDGGHSFGSNWCRVSVDGSNIHNCAVIMADKDQDHGGPGQSCVTVGDMKAFLVNAQATTDNGGAGCHQVGTANFAATFMPKDGLSRWCISAYEYPEECWL